MIQKSDLKKINDYIWEIPKGFRSDMLVPARIYASEKLLSDIFGDRSLEQLINATTLRGIERYAIAMPDVHEGYGLPVGGVFASRSEDGIISPGSVGYDINCGVRLLSAPVLAEEIMPQIKEFVDALFRNIPSGVGRGGPLKLAESEFDEMLKFGVQWALKKNYASEEDLEFIEEKGSMPEADNRVVSEHAKRRGADQLGTIGSGNHFVEVQKVEEIFDETSAEFFGIFQGQSVILIHTGSRGFGHQVATDYINLMRQAMPKYGIEIPDAQLACTPFSSPEGQQYFAAMSCALNFAWVNRQMITHFVRQTWKQIFGQKSAGDLKVVYDVAHNTAKVEKYDGRDLIVHRKGATRSFGPNRNEIPVVYRNVGQPVFIPGSMGTSSFVLAGTRQAEEEAFSSTCHGAGRVMSRVEAKKKIPFEILKKELAAKNIYARGGSISGLVEEAPAAYKNVDEVVRVVHEADFARRVARLTPLGVIKG